MIARVRPLSRTRALRGVFDYVLRGEKTNVEVGSILRVPFNNTRMLGVVVELARDSAVAAERLAEPDEILQPGLPSDLVALADWMAREYCSTPARALSLVLPPGSGGRVGAKVRLVAELTDQGRTAIQDPGATLTARQRAALQRLLEGGACEAATVGTPTLRRLEGRGLVAIDHRSIRRRPANHRVGEASAQAPPLTGEQRDALAPVLAAMESRVSQRFLLHGVTGSGKTEVYLQAVERALGLKRSAIVLVPEIALTPQVLGRVQARFGEIVAVLHSGLSEGQRRDEWLRLREGEARVCVGPRSAVFAPVRDIGLIVVDEEHESSYKHEGDPRYDARGVAEQRAREHGAVLLLGSATPRPESMQGVHALRLRGRIDGRALPPVQVLDMRGQHHPLHPKTRMALADLRRQGGKAIVLLNRRGWSNFLTCRSCGRVWICPQCDVALVLHRDGAVACHHCGHRERIPDRCPACASVSLARHGAGTERIEQELVDALGDQCFPVLRLDADSASSSGRARTLERFESADAGVLVGTQMVAKGHDFPDVTLGVVLDADQTLRFPDFRAEERTFALVTQLAGRAGRGAGGGRVLVQTLAPQARSITFAARHDADGFLADELTRRRALSYPPFSTLIRIVCSASDANAARKVAEALRAQISPPGADVLGPAPLFRLRGRERSQLVVKAREREAAITAVDSAVQRLAGAAARQAVSLSVDVDPQ